MGAFFCTGATDMCVYMLVCFDSVYALVCGVQIPFGDWRLKMNAKHLQIHYAPLL